MGYHEWDTSEYEERARTRAAAGKSAFDYHDTLRSVPSYLRKAHPTLDPLGVRMRESRDSDDHPRSLAIGTILDVTGSMLDIPVTLQKKLPELNGLLVRKGYVENPQIMFGAIGDATCDKVPLQMGQFESDNHMDENLENLYLEGGGGGTMQESYDLGLYFVDKHTDIDCWNKRRHKGYLFMIGDEMAYDPIRRDLVQSVIGDGIEKNIPLADVIASLKRRYHPYFILPKDANHGGDKEVLGFWKRHLGQNVLELDDLDAVCEVIAGQIGINEGITDLDGFTTDLRALGVSESIIRSSSRALVRAGSNLPARGSGRLAGLDDTTGGSSPRRL